MCGTRRSLLAESDLSGNNLREYIYYQGERIVRRDDATRAVYYFFADHLGTVRVTTSATGTTVQRGLG